MSEAVMATALRLDRQHKWQSAAQSVVMRTNSLKPVVVPVTVPISKYQSFSHECSESVTHVT